MYQGVEVFSRAGVVKFREDCDIVYKYFSQKSLWISIAPWRESRSPPNSLCQLRIICSWVRDSDFQRNRGQIPIFVSMY
jgi:hypothetical protein